MTAFYIYCGCTLLVATRLGWHMVFRLDRFDWRYGDVWPNFWITLLLWPLALIKPQILLSPNFSYSSDLPGRYRELERLRTDIPSCGEKIRFITSPVAGPVSAFTFERKVVEHYLTAHLNDQSPVGFDQRHEILRWVSQPNSTMEAVTDVPEAWWKFMYLAADLARLGHGVARCGRCGQETLAGNLVVTPIRICGHGFDRWDCICGGELLTVDVFRILH